MKKRNLIGILIALMVLSISSAFAIPCAFEGYAFIDGNPVPNGTSVKAYVNGVLKSNYTTNSSHSEGFYGLEVDAINETVTFKIENYCVNEAPQICYSGNVTKLNLTANTNTCGNCVCESGESCSSCPGDCGSCPPAAYCGDGICNNGETCSSCSQDCGSCPPPPPPPPSCQENWTCTAWSEWSNCVNNIQTRTRTCTDLNHCNTTLNKPNETETRSCSLPSCSGGQILCDGTCVFPVCASNVDCNDNNACTIDVCNNPNTCTASCTHTLVSCSNNDGCCPIGCNSLNDNDCAIICGNGVCETGESCDSCSEDCGACPLTETTGQVIAPSPETQGPTGFAIAANTFNIGALVLLIIVIYAIYLIFYKKKKEE